MAQADVVPYYALEAWGSKYGETANRPSPHRGLDIKQGAKAVPVLRAGKIVLRAYSSILGYYFVVEVAANDFDGYCHQIFTDPRPIGSAVAQGEFLSRSAGFADNHGSAWTGPHLHLTNGPNKTSVYEGTTRNPAPVVISARTAAAGGTPIPLEGDPTMRTIRHPNGTITGVGETTYQHYADLFTYQCDALLYGAYLQCNDATYNQIVANTQVRKAYLLAGITGGGGSAVDVAAIAVAVNKSLEDDFAKLSTEIGAINDAMPLTEEDIAAIATATVDEQADRLRE